MYSKWVFRRWPVSCIRVLFAIAPEMTLPLTFYYPQISTEHNMQLPLLHVCISSSWYFKLRGKESPRAKQDWWDNWLHKRTMKERAKFGSDLSIPISAYVWNNLIYSICSQRGVVAWQQSSSVSTLFSTCPILPSLLGSQGELQHALLEKVTSWLEPEVEFMIPCIWFLPHAVISWLCLCYCERSPSLAIFPYNQLPLRASAVCSSLLLA